LDHRADGGQDHPTGTGPSRGADLGRSTGCNVGPAEQDAGAAVVNWLNGRGTAHTSPFGNDLAHADWSNGSVGMIGKSNDALTAMGVAASGVAGLKTVIPIAGVSNLYDFWNPGGALIGVPTPDDPPGLDSPRQHLHRWLDRWLLDVPNGIDHEPMISIEHTPNGWVDESRWPPAGTRQQVLRPTAGPTAGLGTLAGGPGSGTESITDSTDINSDHFQWATDPTTPSTERVVFTTAPLAGDVRLAGTSSLTVSVRSSKPVATVSAELVDIRTGYGIQRGRPVREHRHRQPRDPVLLGFEFGHRQCLLSGHHG
ncbi:MAG TPA: CocE/NonD family hydrolase, partial [Pseudonocardiaceae bacterium]|nr:CocE/NonD family hydrolase [Pseudonocardiaceae bacterium]